MPLLRKVLLALGLVAAIVASLMDLPAFDDVQLETASAAPAGAAVVALRKAPAAVAASPLRARFESGAQPADLFALRDWQPQPASLQRKVEAPKAPPLPFHYLGKVLEEGAVVAFVSQGALNHLLRSGDLVADYRVEQITPAEMTFVYLPLNEKQRLTFGSAN